MCEPSLLRTIFEYDKDSGQFIYKSDRGSNRVAGKLAGYRRADGYWVVRVNRRQFLGHRVAWAIVMGHWPDRQIDHINGDKTDNRWENLREATPSQNNCNRTVRRDSQSKLKGVQFHAQSGKWRARLNVGGEHRHLGLFRTPELAHAAFVRAAEQEYGAFARAS